MRYLGLIVSFIGTLQASSSSQEWDQDAYIKYLATPLEIGQSTSWHTITQSASLGTFTPDELKHAKGFERFLIASFEEILKEPTIEWKNTKGRSALVKAIGCVNQSQWCEVRELLLKPYRDVLKKTKIYEPVRIDFHALAKMFFVLGKTPKKYRMELNSSLNYYSKHMRVVLAKDVFDEDFVPLWIMGVKFKRDDFPNNGSFQRYLAHRTSYTFDPGHFWITMKSIFILFQRRALPSSYPIFKKLLELEQPHFLIKLLQTPVPQNLKGKVEDFLQHLKDTPLEPRGPSGKWLQDVLLKNLEYFKKPCLCRLDDTDASDREKSFRMNVWWNSSSD